MQIPIDKLIEWYNFNKRDFPWRTRIYEDTQTWAYHTWICEVMSQQTLLAVVLPKFTQFITHLPTVAHLAECSEELLRYLWSGLGYYARARNLKNGAQFILEQYKGVFPVTQNQWLQVPGCGDYTSSIIASICFAQAVPAIDGNVIRVVSRLLGLKTNVWDTQGQKKIQLFMMSMVHNYFNSSLETEHSFSRIKASPGTFNQAFMELGATVCKKQAPVCEECPLSVSCVAYQTQCVDECPPVKPRKLMQDESIHVLALWNKKNGSYLIVERNKGFLAKTTGFPLVASKGGVTMNQIMSWADASGFTFKTLSQTFAHTITHHKITGFVTLVEVNDANCAVNEFYKILSLSSQAHWLKAEELKNRLSSSLDLKASRILLSSL